ncbi:hypothetical protein [Bacillus fonticola]|uniref:hypothetical protein n=1 Tax=Bacillus fonticola TaxID=2728853 RepID=UPI001474BAE0|nr:hypothetical protein [Bacillus fonticola]
MLPAIDVGLMDNHLSAHEGIVSRLQLYLKIAKDRNVTQVLEKQLQVMKNHVVVMNQLLNPSQQGQVVLPPIPQTTGDNGTEAPVNAGIQIEDRHITLDAHSTANAMANDNFISASAMKNPVVKKIHSEMALQQEAIAKMYNQILETNGWVKSSMAKQQEQIDTANYYSNIPGTHKMTDQTHFNHQNYEQQ